MRSVLSITTWIYRLSIVMLVSACSGQQDYLQSESLPPLSVPEDQRQRLGQLYPVPETERPSPVSFQTPFPPTIGVQADANIASIQTMGDQFWVLNARPPATTWIQLINFFEEREISIVSRDLAAATLITEPFPENTQIDSPQVQYHLRLAKGFQVDTTEIIFSNRLVGSANPAPANQKFGGRLESRSHAEGLVQQWVSVLNAGQVAAFNSFLAATIELEDKVRLAELAGEPVLSVSASETRLLRAFDEGLNENGFIVYDVNDRAQVLYFDRYRKKEGGFRWHNPLSWWSGVQSRKDSRYSLTFILSALPDESDVSAVFDSVRPNRQADSKSANVPGYLLAYQRRDGKYTVYVRDGSGRKLPIGEARELLNDIRVRLI
ncbi:MAG: hypothetical protein ACI82Z_000997 [Cellvibrionaceae bacterium]|jgi:hypothetical protein